MTKILTIDDKQSNLMVFTALISKAFPNAHTITALSGKEGIDKALAQIPDVIIIDLVMPIMDGIETCKRLKEYDLLKPIPVIMITAATTDSKTRTKALQSGVQSFLSKPIDEAELAAQISSIIRFKKSENQIFLENEQIKEQKRLRTHELENELKKMITRLEEARKKAEKSGRLESIFLSNLSHEIRTPMNGILGFSSLLKEPNLTGEEQQQYIDVIEKSGYRMLNTINELIEISRIETGQLKVSMSEININEQIESIYNSYKTDVEAKGMKFSFKNNLTDKEARIRTDSKKLNTILTNLINNAIKYSKNGSIEFGYEKKEKYLEFFVKDTGIGIRQKQKKIVFKAFRQGSESLSRSYEGLGLGLAISKAYVEILHGKIWLESEEGKGSIFYFSIPFIQVHKKKVL